MNQAMLLAATLLLCAVPFMLVAAALAGRSMVSELSWQLGLTKQATADVGHPFTSSSATSAAVTGLSWVFLILAGMAVATAIQRLYQRVFGLDPRDVMVVALETADITLMKVLPAAEARRSGRSQADTVSGHGSGAAGRRFLSTTDLGRRSPVRRRGARAFRRNWRACGGPLPHS